MGQRRDVLYYSEIENFVDALQPLPLELIGSLRWFEQHEMLEKLNLQALYEAKIHSEEVVCERIVFFGKASTLVQTFITQGVWNEKVFPQVSKFFKSGCQAFPTYMVMYQLITVASLLECLTYRENFCETLDDLAIDLIDFCHGAIATVIKRKSQPDLAGRLLTSRISGDRVKEDFSELQRQKDDIDTILSTKCVGILCHLIQHGNVLCLSAVSRMCDHHDMPLFLAGLLENSPWTLKVEEKVFKFFNGEWKDVPQDDRLRVTQTEGQLWIALHQFLLNPEYSKKYQLDDYRRTRLMRLTSLMHETLIDQLPALSSVQRYLHSLGLMETPTLKKGLILEQSPVIRDQLLEVYRNRWDELAHRHLESLSGDTSLLKSIASRMANIYTTDNMEPVLPEPAKCALCGHPAKQRCSSCQQEWYCRRECQVKHWPKHKQACDTLKNGALPNER